MKTKLALAIAGFLAVGGCATTSGDTNFAERSETVNLSGTVEAVNLDNRTFQVRDGRTTVVFKAGPQVKNLAQLEPGDKIEMEYYESVAVGIADPADPGTVMGDAMAIAAAPGQKPGGAAVGSVTAVVDFVSFDAGSDTATLKLPDGTIERVTVQPEMRSFASARQPGDRIVVAMDRAVAVSVTHIE